MNKEIFIATSRAIMMKIMRCLAEEIEIMIIVSCKVILIGKNPLQPVGIIKLFI